MKGFQVAMACGIIIMASGGIGMMLTLYFGGRLKQDVSTEVTPPQKALDRFHQLKIAQYISATVFLIGFLVMAVAADMR